MSDTVEKRVATICVGHQVGLKKFFNEVKYFLAQLDDQHESHNKFFVTLFSTLSELKKGCGELRYITL